MSTKITLGKTPKTFASVPVKFQLPDGRDSVIECVFKYRSRKQFGEFLAETFGAAQPTAADATLADVMASAVDRNGAYLADVLDSWSLDEPLSAETAVQLADEVPAAATAIMEAYGRAVSEGRLGN
jgi:hypothetical protein